MSDSSDSQASSDLSSSQDVSNLSDSQDLPDPSASEICEQMMAVLKSADYLKDLLTDTNPDAKILSLLTDKESVKDFFMYVLAYSPKRDNFRPSKIPTGNDLVRLIVLFPIISLVYGWFLGKKSTSKNSE